MPIDRIILVLEKVGAFLAGESVHGIRYFVVGVPLTRRFAARFAAAAADCRRDVSQRDGLSITAIVRREMHTRRSASSRMSICQT